MVVSSELYRKLLEPEPTNPVRPVELEISPEKKVARPEVVPTVIDGEPEIITSPPVSVPADSFLPAITFMHLQFRWL